MATKLSKKDHQYELTYTDSHGEISTRTISNIVKITNETISAFCHLRGAVRTFSADGINQVIDKITGEILDLKACGITPSKKRSSSLKIDPSEFFHDWHYQIDKSHYPAFGIARREFVDKERTKAKKETLKAQGIITKETVKYFAWSILIPTQHDFHEGDLFYSHDGNNAVQVIQIKDQIETHYLDLSESGKSRSAFAINQPQLIDWLKSGKVPIKNRITPDQSSSEIFRYMIKQTMP